MMSLSNEWMMSMFRDNRLGLDDPRLSSSITDEMINNYQRHNTLPKMFQANRIPAHDRPIQ